MRLILITLIFVPSILSAQSIGDALPERAYFVKQCSSAARLAAMMARTYPDDEASRADSFRMVVQATLNPPPELTTHQKVMTPTLEQYNTVFIVMEGALKARSSQSTEYLNEQIISEAAATCMAGALGS